MTRVFNYLLGLADAIAILVILWAITHTLVSLTSLVLSYWE